MEGADEELRQLIDRMDLILLERPGPVRFAVLLGLSGFAERKNPAAYGSGVFEGPQRCEVIVGCGSRI